MLRLDTYNYSIYSLKEKGEKRQTEEENGGRERGKGMKKREGEGRKEL